MIYEIGKFKNNPVLIMKTDENDKWPFTIGLRKAKTILASIKEIKSFVEQHDKSDEPEESEMIE